VFSSN